MTPGAAERLNVRVLLAYALPAFVVALPTIPVYIHLPALYGVEMGLGLAATGGLLLVARLFDTVTDPLIGALSDRFHFRGARRKPWIAIGAVIAALGLFKVLHPPAGVDETYLLIWCVVLYGGWTMVAVPYMAWGAELSTDYDQRTRITSWRESMTVLGILGAGILAAVTAKLGWTEIRSIGAVAWLAILIGAAVIPVLLFGVPDRPTTARTQAPRMPFCSLLSNAPFLRLLAGWFLNGIANGIPAALFFIYLEFALGAGPGVRPLFILAYFGAGIFSIPVWSRLSARYGKHHTWCVAMITAAVVFLTVPFIPMGALWAFAAVCIVTGMALGADLTLPPAIQADVVDYDQWRFGHRRAGLQFALWGMSTKFALAVAVGLALPALEFFGFDPAAPTVEGISALVMIYAVVPAVIKVMAVAVVWHFPLTRVRQAIIRRRLSRRSNLAKEAI